jgi:hypothetical protein
MPEAPSAPAAIAKLAEKPESTTDAERSVALDWFLNEDPQEAASDSVELNVGGPVGTGKERFVPFRIQVVDRERIRAIRKQSETGTGDEREVDEMEANLRIAVEGLLDPDLKVPENRVVRGQKYMDPADALKARFAHKPGLIDQLAGKIVNLSGYDDKDVREVRAAKN